MMINSIMRLFEYVFFSFRTDKNNILVLKNHLSQIYFFSVIAWSKEQMLTFITNLLIFSYSSLNYLKSLKTQTNNNIYNKLLF